MSSSFPTLIALFFHLYSSPSLSLLSISLSCYPLTMVANDERKTSDTASKTPEQNPIVSFSSAVNQPLSQSQIKAFRLKTLDTLAYSGPARPSSEGDRPTLRLCHHIPRKGSLRKGQRIMLRGLLQPEAVRRRLQCRRPPLELPNVQRPNHPLLLHL